MFDPLDFTLRYQRTPGAQPHPLSPLYQCGEGIEGETIK